MVPQGSGAVVTEIPLDWTGTEIYFSPEVYSQGAAELSREGCLLGGSPWLTCAAPLEPHL